MSQDKNEIYHEKQRLQLCALHSLNNLFQKERFTKADLDQIVHKYDRSWCWNEYSSLFTGNYDLTILLDALEGEGYTLRAIDKHESFEDFKFEQSRGLLLNTPLKRPILERIPFLRSITKPGRHWFTIVNLDGTFYNCDSNRKEAQSLGDRTGLIRYLEELNRAEAYIYIVIHKDLIKEFEQ